MDFLNDLLGLDAGKLTESQMCARAVVIFIASLLYVRLAGIRTLGRQSAFDILTSLMLGAVLGRAIVSEQSFFGSLLAALVIVLLHRLVAWISFRSKKAGKVLKGEALLLVRDGAKNAKHMRQGHITDEDMEEAMRHSANENSMSDVKEIYLERCGEISIVKKKE